LKEIVEMDKELFSAEFPELSKNISLRHELVDLCETVAFGPGDVLLKEGSFVKFVPLVLKGLVKVYKEDGDGNEILLYYIRAGQSCIMSATYCIQNEKSKVKAVVVEDCSIILVPVSTALAFNRKYSGWVDFMFRLFSAKYNELIHTIGILTFSRKDRRLKEYLEKASTLRASREISITHQQIADDLGSTREVISRLLKKLEKDGFLELQHRKVILT